MDKAIIFLDIDGVLATNLQFFMNRAKFWRKNPEMEVLDVPYPWDKGAVDVFNEILDETGAEIVLSSDWRLYFSLSNLETIFKFNGVKKWPIAVTGEVFIASGNQEMTRAAEIDDYIKEHNVTNYVVIDDLNIGKYMTSTGDDDKFFMTTNRDGVKKSGLKTKIINKLKFNETNI
jgi:hypothetical protein